MQVIQAGFGIVVVATVAEGALSADGVCGGVLELHELAPSVIGVGYDELAGGGIGEGYYITLEVVDVIVKVVAAVGHADTVTLLVVEKARGLAVGRLGENLRTVEQVLCRICAVALAGSDALGIVGVTKGRSTFFRRYKLPALPCHTPATVAVGFQMAS